MGIYIRGVDMPMSCGECLDIGWHYVFECRLDDAEEGKRLETCPLFPVPPHGRLIEAERLKEVFHRNVVSGDAFDQLIDIAPTIIQAEEEQA